MKSNYIKSMLLVGALAMPLAGHAANDNHDADKGTNDSAKTEVKDSVITTKVKAIYAKDKAVSAMNIKVNTDNGGVVKLSGTAKTQAEADKAFALARNVEGVTSVENSIEINAK